MFGLVVGVVVYDEVGATVGSGWAFGETLPGRPPVPRDIAAVGRLGATVGVAVAGAPGRAVDTTAEAAAQGGEALFVAPAPRAQGAFGAGETPTAPDTEGCFVLAVEIDLAS
jgi:hypothetical protein